MLSPLNYALIDKLRLLIVWREDTAAYNSSHTDLHLLLYAPTGTSSY
jgi:hypothetical protein